MAISGHILLIGFCLVGLTTIHAFSFRILNGQSAVKGQFPHQVAIIFTIKSLNLTDIGCGGSIINERWVLTAAHCIHPEYEPEFKLLVGAIEWRKGEPYDVEKIIVHKDYHITEGGKYAFYDIALMKAKKQIKFSDVVKPIAIGSSFVGGGEVATSSGWGLTEVGGRPSEVMKYMDLNTMTNKECVENDKHFEVVGNDTSVLCGIAEGKTACTGDSGGPLTMNNKLIGVVSYGIDFCPVAKPVVYTRVSHYVDWIEENIKQN